VAGYFSDRRRAIPPAQVGANTLTTNTDLRRPFIFTNTADIAQAIRLLAHLGQCYEDTFAGFPTAKILRAVKDIPAPERADPWMPVKFGLPPGVFG
jgi:hypothetical protein